MTVQSDVQIGYKKEASFGVAETVDTFIEPSEEDLDWLPEFVQGAGLRVGRRVNRADRRAVGREWVGGSFTTEVLSKGHGKLFEAALGTATSTVASGSAYQQLFTPTATDYLNSYTIQKGIPPLGGGTTLAHTFNGMVCSGFEFTSSNAGLPTITWNWIGKGYDTTTALETASYASGTEIFSFPNATLTLGGTVTVPTTTALSSGGTATSNIREFNFTWDNALDENGFNFGGAGKRSRKPAVGIRSGTGNFVAEFDGATVRNLFLNQTNTALTYKLLSGTAITGAYYPALEFTIPCVRLEGEIPKANGGDVITLSCDFTVLDNGTAAHPLYVAIVTAETAI